MNTPETTTEAPAEMAEIPRNSYPGERLHEGSRRVLFLCFFAIFILTAHQHLFAGHQRSKVKLIILMGLAPIIIGSGLCGAIGWWMMRGAGAFKNEAPKKSKTKETIPDPPIKKREKRKARRDGPELLPWQRRDKQ